MAVVVYVPSRLGEGFFTDLPAPTAGDDAKAITYDHGTGAFVYAAASATPPGSDTQVIINDAGAYGADPGLTYAKATDRLTVSGGLVAPSMRPASNSTTALQWQNAAGTGFVYGDTTNARIGINVTPSASLHIGDGNSVAAAFMGGLTTPLVLSSAQTTVNYLLGVASNTPAERGTFLGVRSRGSLAVPAAVQNGDYTLAFIGCGYDGAANQTSAGIFFIVDGSVGGGVVPESIGLYTSPTTGAGRIERMVIKSTGYIGVNNASPTALFDIAASTTARASSRQRAGTAPTTPNDGDMWNDGNAYALMVNGANAVNTDGGLSIWMQSSITARNVGRLLWQYTDKTDATRVTKGALTAFYQSTERKAIHWSADSAGPLLSFGAVTTPIATPVLATGASATPDDIIQVLQNLGLVKQS